MVKNEQLRNNDQLKRIVPNASAASVPPRPPMFQTIPIVIPQRSIDPHAIDISSIKGRFAWEKIALGDTCMPVIFRYVNINITYRAFFQRLSLRNIVLYRTI
jgi:hypothetical protein